MPRYRLDRRLTISTPTTSDDGAGGQTVTWSTLARVWGSMQAQASREYLQGTAIQDAATVFWRIRYRDDVTVKQRVRWDTRSKTYEIVGVRELDEFGRNRWLELECVEVDS